MNYCKTAICACLLLLFGALNAQQQVEHVNTKEFKFILGKKLELLQDVYLVRYPEANLYLFRVPGRDNYPSVEAYNKRDFDSQKFEGKIEQIVSKGSTFTVSEVREFTSESSEKSFFTLTQFMTKEGFSVEVIADFIFVKSLEQNRSNSSTFFIAEDFVKVHEDSRSLQ
ncbi:MAG: hypothetical protein L7U87_02380 [Chlamydiales bacterium]|nr:hypothetical protein [Chlamydiales bacterium]